MITIKINPVPASRPRVTRWSTYYGKKYTAFRREIKSLIPKMDLVRGAVMATQIFYVQMPKGWSEKKKLELDGQWCNNNADIDNYEKALFDALNGRAYHDDSQAVASNSAKFWAREGRIEFKITRPPSPSVFRKNLDN